MPTNKETFNTKMTALANAINSKAGSSGAKDLDALKTAVDSISTGTDTSDATAYDSDILFGKTAYARGSKITGNILSQAAQTITPTTTDQIISSGKYLSGNQTIKGDANLIAGNIKKDVSIFGVTGTYEGGGSGSAGTPVLVGLQTGTYNNSTVTVKAAYDNSNVSNPYCIDEDGNEYNVTNGIFQYRVQSSGTWGNWTNISAGTTTISPGSGSHIVQFRFLNTNTNKPFGMYQYAGVPDYETYLQVINNKVGYTIFQIFDIRHYVSPPALPIFIDDLMLYSQYTPSSAAQTKWSIAGEED